MNYKKTTLSLLIALSFGASAQNNIASNTISMDVKSITTSGAPSFVTGQLGIVKNNNKLAVLTTILNTEPSFGYSGKETFKIKRRWVDNLGNEHTRYKQLINGLPVYGTSMTLHTRKASQTTSSNGQSATTQTQSNVYALTGQLAKVKKTKNQAMTSTLSASDILSYANQIGKVHSTPELSYVYKALSSETILAWKVDVSFTNEKELAREFVFFDAETGNVVTRHAKLHSAKSIRTYSLDNSEDQSSFPGRLVCTDNQSCEDQSAQRAHDGAAKVYDYYQTKFGRDGIDDKGMTTISSVHLGNQVNNAYWTGSQIIYGDGDGNQFTDLTKDFDIIAHELTHGVTQKTANLTYQNASGALNEAFSDILGISAEAWKNGASVPHWTLGGDAYTPNIPNDGLRYMNNPTQDNRSKDYYPERTPFESYPTQQNDYGGVHTNSGIANLAYALLVEGGQHPRNKTTAQVPGIGLEKSEKIFYQALTQYLNESSNFSDAREATELAAADLYSESEKTAVSTAWCAVGVGECPTSTPDPTPDSELENGVIVNVSGNAQQVSYFTLEVPTGATNLSIATTGGSGDVDLYVKALSKPTTESYDCRPYQDGNEESCDISDIQSGTYHVMLVGYTDYANVSLKASFDEDDSSTPTNPVITLANSVSTNASGDAGNEQLYQLSVPKNAAGLSFTTTGGSGDVSLYVQATTAPTSQDFECSSSTINSNQESCQINNAQEATYFMLLKGESAYNNVAVTASYTVENDNGIVSLDNNVAITVGGNAQEQTLYSILLPSNATSLNITTTGGSGDVDMYVQFENQPSESSYDCRPYQNGNEESCQFSNVQQGTYFIMLQGFSVYDGVSLTASYTTNSNDGGNDTESCQNIEEWDGAKWYYPEDYVTYGGAKYQALWYSFGYQPDMYANDWKNLGTCE
ncbi:M4 family metallopeptidase [Colwelliaceae bacterium 6441]